MYALHIWCWKMETAQLLYYYYDAQLHFGEHENYSTDSFAR